MRTCRKTLARVAITAALVCICGQNALAQTASPWLAADHWASRAAARLHALGLTPDGFDAAAREHTSDEVGALLRHAWLRTAARALPGSDSAPAPLDHAATLRLVDGYVRRFADDRPAAFARAVGVSPERSYVHAEAAAGFAQRDDAVLAGGFTLDREWLAPRAVPDFAAFGGTIDAAGVWRDRFAVTVRAAREGHAGRIERATIDAKLSRHVTAWVGRRAGSYSPARSGGLVLHGKVASEGGGVRLAAPARVPLLGATTAEMFVGGLDANGHVERPWLWTSRLHVQPHSRLAIGGTRAAVFGALAGERLGIQQVAQVIIGANLGDDFADDQVASLDVRWRPPVGNMPLQLYGEWGVHDIDAQVFFDVPAFSIGARLATLPFTPAMGVALEHTQINRSCCENPPWYHHFELADGWTEDGVLLGHPLGGHGREWRAVVDGSISDARVLFELHAYHRTRGEENLFAPTRAGRSRGARLSLDARPAARVMLVVDAAIESGTAWTERAIAAYVGIRL